MIVIPYKKFEGNANLPFVSFLIQGNDGRRAHMDAFVDSGADCSIFHADLMKILRLDRKEATIKKIQVGDGDFIHAWLFNVDVTFCGLRFKAPITFSDQLGPGFNLLGRNGFFNRFRFCFDDKHCLLTLTRL